MVVCIFIGVLVLVGVDVVVMQEFCEYGENGVVINYLLCVGENICCVGEDILIGVDIFQFGIKLWLQDIVLVVLVGLFELLVYCWVCVGVFFIGDELVQLGELLLLGVIYNFNCYVLCVLFEGMGCEVCDFGIVLDNFELICEVLCCVVVDNDLIVISGGVLVGEEDYVKLVVEVEGQFDMWKIVIKLGKLLVFGEVCCIDGKAWFIGLLGNLVLVIVIFLIMVWFFVLCLQGVVDVMLCFFMLCVDFDWLCLDVCVEFLCVWMNENGGVELYLNQGVGVVILLCWGDGLVLNKLGLVINKGDSVCFVFYLELLL